MQKVITFIVAILILLSGYQYFLLRAFDRRISYLILSKHEGLAAALAVKLFAKQSADFVLHLHQVSQVLLPEGEEKIKLSAEYEHLIKSQVKLSSTLRVIREQERELFKEYCSDLFYGCDSQLKPFDE